MRTALLALQLVVALVASTAFGATPVRVDNRDFRRISLPAQAPTVRTETSGGVGPWLNVGPNYFPGRFHCVTADILNSLSVAAGADGSGYWWGYSFSDYPGNFVERGKELGGGVRQLTHRLHFPGGGEYYQVASVIRGDGATFHSNDDGVTWTPNTLNVPPGYSLGGARQLGYDSGSINVAYALVYGTDDLGQDGVAFLRSFDGGQEYDMTRFIPTQRAHMWTSREGSGEILLAWSDGTDAHIERNDGLGDESNWHDVGVIPSVFEDLDSDSILIAAQEWTAPDYAHIWVHLEGTLFRTTDGGANWEQIQSYTTGSERSLGTSLIHPDLVMWTTGDGQAFHSIDGGVTAIAFDTSWPSPDAIHPTAGDIDCWKWNFTPTLASYSVRRPSPSGRGLGPIEIRTLPASAAQQRPDALAAASPGDEERIFFSGGGGVFSWYLESAAPVSIARFGAVTQQINDLVTLRDGVDKYRIVTATRDAGIAGMASSGPTLPDDSYWNFLITSSWFDIGHVLTSFKPNAFEPVLFADFPYGGVTAFGDGVFNGVGVPTGGVRHPAMVADPVGPYRFWVASDNLYRVTWNRETNTWTTDQLLSPIPFHGHAIAFAIAPSNPSQWYLETSDRTVFFSSNAGATWNPTSIFGPVPVSPDYDYTKFVINPANALEAWLVGADNVLHTTNGALWLPETSGLPPGFGAWDIALDSTPSHLPYLATERGPFRWNGATWADLAPAGGEVPAVPFRAVENVSWAGVMRFGTWGRGVWDYSTGVTTAVGGDDAATLRLSATQNPVREFARLDYTLPQAGSMTLEILDVSGRRVATLVDGLQPAGPGSATLDSRGLGAGVYFARLQSARGSLSTRLVVIP